MTCSNVCYTPSSHGSFYIGVCVCVCDCAFLCVPWLSHACVTRPVHLVHFYIGNVCMRVRVCVRDMTHSCVRHAKFMFQEFVSLMWFIFLHWETPFFYLGKPRDSNLWVILMTHNIYTCMYIHIYVVMFVWNGRSLGWFWYIGKPQEIARARDRDGGTGRANVGKRERGEIE